VGENEKEVRTTGTGGTGLKISGKTKSHMVRGGMHVRPERGGGLID